MFLILAVLAARLATEPQIVTRAPPTAEEISILLTLDRFDDRCDESSNNSCPMINIYRVDVQNPQCGLATPAQRERHALTNETAFFCRFESKVTIPGLRRSTSSWQKDDAMFASTGGAWRLAPEVTRAKPQ